MTAAATGFSGSTANTNDAFAADTLASAGEAVPLRVSAASGMVSLSWTASSTYADYQVQRATSPSGPFTDLAVIPTEPAGFREFDLPAQTSPYGITNGPDGALWFTARTGNRIGRMTSSGAVSWYALPRANAQPETIVAGPDGALWFTEPGVNRIGKITTSGTITEYLVPTANSVPKGITSGGDGYLYFTERAGAKVARISTDGAITEFGTLPNGSVNPNAIVWGPDANLWLTDGGTGGIDRVAPDGTASARALPTASSTPAGISVGPGGNVWFTEPNANKVGKFSPYYDSWSPLEFPLSAGSTPFGIIAGPDGNTWFTETDGNKIGRVTSAGVITEYAVPTAGSGPTHLTVGPDGAMWFTEAASNKIGRYAVGLTTGFTDTTASPDKQYYYRLYGSYRSWTSPPGLVSMSLSMKPSSATDTTRLSTTIGAAGVAALTRADNATYTTAGDWFSTSNLRALDADDPMAVWAVGDQGQITETTDGGLSWQPKAAVTTKPLKAINFIDATRGWAAGDGGTILATTDGGNTWTAQDTGGSTTNLRDLTFVSATLGWAVGDRGTILAWNGSTWSLQTSGATVNLKGASAVSATNVWVVGDGGTMLRYNGTSWTATTPSPVTTNLQDVVALDATHAWAVGDRGVILAYDGTAWTSQPSGTTKNLLAVDAVTASAVWAGGQTGTLLRYGGSSWSPQTSGSIADLNDISFSDTSTGHFVTSGGGPSAGTPQSTTTDGGVTWTTPAAKYLEVVFPPVSVASGAPDHTVRATVVYRTSAVPKAGSAFKVDASFDGGATWSTKALTKPTSTATVTQTVDFATALTDPAQLATYGVRLRFVADSGDGIFTTTHDSIRLDVN